jgi:transcriptional regulator with XRE-family HTH domain
MRGNRLKEVRENAGHTQESLAELLGKDIKQIWRWEAEKVVPSSEAIVELCNALQVSADYLLGLSDNPIPNKQPNDVSPVEWAMIRALRDRDIIHILSIVVQMHGRQARED